MVKKMVRKIDSFGLVQTFDVVYDDRLVAFLDILGFSRMVLDGKDDDVEFLLNLIPDMMRTHKGSVLRDDLQVTIVSDSIILSVKATPENLIKDLFNICVIVGRIQHELALNGCYMRGGISVGKMVHDSKNNLIVGPAYINAYLLESQKSIVPRVIIGKEVVDFYGKNYDQLCELLNDETTQSYYKGNLIAKHEMESAAWAVDSEIFIDYASTFAGREKAGFRGTITTFMRQIEEALLRGVAVDKYQWLAHYALSTIESPSDWIDKEVQACCDRIQAILKKK